MAKSLQEWVESDVQPQRDMPLSWLSQQYFFRDPLRSPYSDAAYFFAPADGIILYQATVTPEEPIVDIKGKSYSLRDAMRQSDFDQTCLVIGIFMTFYDVHVNRIPYPGRVSYKLLDPIDTYNYPMLEVERSIIEDLRLSLSDARYLHCNQRVLSRVDSIQLGQAYYLLQIADYDVDSITPFELKQNQPFCQGQRFSQIRYGSQVDLIIPLSSVYEFVTIHPTGFHVEAGVDPLVEIRERNRP